MSHVAESVGEENWNDIITPGFALGVGASEPVLDDFTPVPGMQLYSFSGIGVVADELFTVIELPHNYKEGTDLRPHIHWTPDTAVIANVKWQMSYSMADVDGLFPAATTLAVVQATSGVNVHKAAEFDPVIPGVGLKIGAQIAIRIFRAADDPQDTYTGSAKLLSFGIHYQTDTLGSRNVFTK